MRFYHRCTDRAYKRVGHPPNAGATTRRNKAVLQTHDFDRVSCELLTEDGGMGDRDQDPTRSPRALMTGIALGMALWGAVIATLLALF
jgi:hypothetical protein